jgi:hypoxanthine phosphoribosyltransferase
VLRGGLFFFCDLARSIDTSVEIAPIKASSYDNSANGVQLHSVSVVADGVDVRGRSVLIVDDFCDSGRTLEEVERLLVARGAEEVRSSVLVRRLLDKPTFVPCWVGFEYDGADWLVGYGLEDKERWRNLPAVYGMKAS